MKDGRWKDGETGRRKLKGVDSRAEEVKKEGTDGCDVEMVEFCDWQQPDDDDATATRNFEACRQVSQIAFTCKTIWQRKEFG